MTPEQAEILRDQLEPSYEMTEDDFVEMYGEESRRSIQIALEGMEDEATGAREAAVMGFLDHEALSKEKPVTPAARLPEMSEQERIDLGYVPVSHAPRHRFPRNDV